jgi:hypothetical protein
VRLAFALQHQYGRLQELYSELKAHKISELEGMLEQTEEASRVSCVCNWAPASPRLDCLEDVKVGTQHHG